MERLTQLSDFLTNNWATIMGVLTGTGLGWYLVRLLFRLVVLRIESKTKVGYYDKEKKQIWYEVPKKKVTAPKEFDYERTVNIRREDIDFNGHVHNSKYIVYALDILIRSSTIISG